MDECHLSQAAFFLVRSSVMLDAFITTVRESTLGKTGLSAYVCFSEDTAVMSRVILEAFKVDFTAWKLVKRFIVWTSID